MLTVMIVQTDKPDELRQFLGGIFANQIVTTLPDQIQTSLSLPVPEADKRAPGASAAAVDGDGIPWDARIHSCGKSQIKGRWRLKRGVSAEMVAQVVEELRGRGNGGVASEGRSEEP
ncbi:MAG: hypothetical protein HQM01_08115 [Magnetococcales bacterium]|nr:hypothetical protein [Magnetococcales bacterium]